MDGDHSLCRNCGLAVFRVNDWSVVKDPFCTHGMFAHAPTAMYCCGRAPHSVTAEGKLVLTPPWPAGLNPPTFAEAFSNRELDAGCARMWADLEGLTSDLP